jgi:hypothetical protein
VSAYYFNAGQFRLPLSGFTHYASAGGNVTLSAYRFMTDVPLTFTDGARLTWRNGDTTDPATGFKCLIETGGRVVGNPQTAEVLAYAWTYTW